MAEFVRVGAETEFPRGRGRAVQVGTRRIAVFRSGERWFALQDACPHMGASLADGRLEGGQVVCHWHGWTYDLESGANASPRRGCARVFAIKIEAGAVFVELVPPERRPWDPPAADDAADASWGDPDPESFFRKKS